MQAPARSGSQFFNYKKSHSIVLMAIVNAKYELICVDIGDAGRQSDGGVFSQSNMGFAFDQKLLNIPEPRALPGSPTKFPFVLVRDEAFPFKGIPGKAIPQRYSDNQRKNCELQNISYSKTS